MLNQVKLEGILVSQWVYKGEVFLRLAHHQPHRKGEVIHSDYVTVRVDLAYDNLPQLHQGDLVRLEGEVRGKDILEPLGRLLQKARIHVELTSELENLIVPRPTIYILARKISLAESKEEAIALGARVAGRPVRFRAKQVSERKKENFIDLSFTDLT